MVQFQKQRRIAEEEAPPLDQEALEKRVIIHFKSATDDLVGDDIEVPMATTAADLRLLLRSLVPDLDEECALVIAESGSEIKESLAHTFAKDPKLSTENTVQVAFYSLVPFRVRPAKRLTGSLSGHTGTVLCLAFSPDANSLATGSGDCEVRLWDTLTRTPTTTLRGHTRPVVSIAWSACGRFVATGSEDKTIRVWDVCETVSTHTGGDTNNNTPTPGVGKATPTPTPTVGKASPAAGVVANKVPCRVLQLHKDAVTALDFMPLHLHSHWESQAPLLLSGSRAGELVVWNVVLGRVVRQLHGHTKMVTAARWSAMTEGCFEGEQAGEAGVGGGVGGCVGPFVYSAARDMSVRVWTLQTGLPLAEVKGHGHWVNTLSLNTAGVMRMGASEPGYPMGVPAEFSAYNLAHVCAQTRAEILGRMAAQAAVNFNKALFNLGEERVVLCSDDNTLSLWSLLRNSAKPRARMTGHQKAVCDARFSPNGRFIVSTGFDSAVRLWDGRTGVFAHTFRGHVGAVYQVAWAPDSRLFATCSKDSTIKIWDASTRKLTEDLPGAADEIFAIDWSADGANIASGGKDKIIRFWSP